MVYFKKKKEKKKRIIVVYFGHECLAAFITTGRNWTWYLDRPKVNTNLGFIFLALGPSEHLAGFRLAVVNRTVQWRSGKMVPVQRIPVLTRSRQQTASSEGETLDRTLVM